MKHIKLGSQFFQGPSEK